MAQRLWFNDFPLTSDKFHSQYLPTFVFQSWTFAFWIKYLCPAWHITAPTIWVPNWVPYRCQQIKYCNSYGGERLLLLSRIGIFSPGWCWAPPLTMGHWSHVRVVTRGQKVTRSLQQLESGLGLVSQAASGAIRIILAEASAGPLYQNGWTLQWSHYVCRVARIRRRRQN